MFFRHLSLISLLLLTAVASVFAADGVWTNNGGGNWSDTGKWKDGVVADGADSTAAFRLSIVANTHVATLDVSRAIGTLVTSDTISQDNFWTLSDGGNAAISLTFTNTTADTPIIISSNRMTYLNVPLAGSQGLVLNSKNLLSPDYGIVLGRTNRYTGVTTIRVGEIRVATNAPAGAPGAFGQDTSAIQIGDANTLPTDILGLRLYPYVTMERDIEVQNVGSNVTIGATADTSAYWRTFKGALKLNRSIDLSTGSNGKIIMESLISGSGGLTVGAQAYSGSIVEFYATNTYTGPTTISRGTIYFYTNVPSGANGALGNSTTDVVLGNESSVGYAIYLSLKPGATFGRNLWVKDVGSAGVVSLGTSAAGVGTYAGNIRIDRKLTVSGATSSYKPLITGVISGTGSVEITGTGDYGFENTNTYSGDFFHAIGNGRLYLGQDVTSGQPGPLGNSTNPVYFTGAGTINHYIYFTNTLTFGRNIRANEGVKAAFGVSSGNLFPEITGDIEYAGDLALSASDNAQLRVSGKMTTQTNTLTVSGVSSLGCYITLANPSNQLFGTINIGQGARLVVEASGAVHGATQIVYSAVSGVNPSALFAGGGVTITQAIVMPLSAYAPSTLVDLGMRTNGVAVFSGPVTLTRINTAPIFNFTAPLNALARFTAPVTGFFVMRKTGVGTVAFEGINSWTNDSEITAGTLRAVDGQGLPATSRLILNGTGGGGVFESTGTFTRALGNGPGQVFWWTNNTGYGGFSAQGGKLTVDLNNNGRDNLVWGLTFGFVSNAVQQLRFGSPLADSEIEFIENIALTAGQYANIYVYDNPASRSDKATLSGVISGTTPFYKYGPGVLALNATNTLTGNLFCSDGGTLLVNGELPSTASTLTVYSNSFLGGSGIIRTRTVAMNPGSGFDWADAPGTLTITNSFTFPTNGVFRFVNGAAGASKVVCDNKLTLPATGIVDVVTLDGYPPFSAIILTSPNTVGSVDGWTVASNKLDYVVVKNGNDVILQRRAKGTVLMVR
jgi:hypothetical protein